MSVSIWRRSQQHHDGAWTDGDMVAGLVIGCGRPGGGCRVVGIELDLPCGLRPGFRKGELERFPPGVDQDQEVVVDQPGAVGRPGSVFTVWVSATALIVLPP